MLNCPIALSPSRPLALSPFRPLARLPSRPLTRSPSRPLAPSVVKRIFFSSVVEVAHGCDPCNVSNVKRVKRFPRFLPTRPIFSGFSDGMQNMNVASNFNSAFVCRSYQSVILVSCCRKICAVCSRFYLSTKIKFSKNERRYKRMKVHHQTAFFLNGLGIQTHGDGAGGSGGSAIGVSSSLE